VDPLPPEGDSDIVIVDAGEARDGPGGGGQGVGAVPAGGSRARLIFTCPA
jgi:hypothetical protein